MTPFYYFQFYYLLTENIFDIFRAMFGSYQMLINGIDFSRHATKHRTKYIKNILGQQVIKLKVINLSKITVNRVSNKIEGCGHFTIKWLTVIFDRLSGLISRIPCLVFFRFRGRNFREKISYSHIHPGFSIFLLSCLMSPMIKIILVVRHLLSLTRFDLNL